MDVARLLETRAQEILAQAILKGMEAPSEVESRAARDDAKKRALRAEAALDATMRRWEETRKQLENHRAVIDPEKAAQAKELAEKKAELRILAATVRQAMQDHGIDRAEFEKKIDENDKLNAEIDRLLKIVEGEERKENVMREVSALKLADAASKVTTSEETGVEELETGDEEMQC